MKSFFTLLLALLLVGLAHGAQAQDMVYQPKNPAFGGGNPFNYSWLQASATAQNTIPDPVQPTTAQDPLAQFATNLNQQVLAQLTNRLITSQFGSGAIRPGTYTVGGYQVQVSQGTSGVVVQVTDTGTGNQTIITIPNGL
ncbi:curli assembly protein CsgF [Hymenobacter sp. DH14]|uniref:Curli production assembly/transport component CsgF n=1 Tax=Hymenobacter cyanobacteriorum TaxID=2926463 RepID=A0A9X1VH68_9BACT|nr:curli production assembly/transport component CsgF [Hymenobacter cyanobacteriorum]MCI1188103.1 curli assembly protein CsgF [Hymenobacter cyanobacteriorum]